MDRALKQMITTLLIVGVTVAVFSSIMFAQNGRRLGAQVTVSQSKTGVRDAANIDPAKIPVYRVTVRTA